MEALADEYANLLPNALSTTPTMTSDGGQFRERELSDMLHMARDETAALVARAALDAAAHAEQIAALDAHIPPADAAPSETEQRLARELGAATQKLARANKLNEVLKAALRSGALKAGDES